MQMSKLSNALALAVQAHEGQVRKSTTIPYIAHPMAVSAIALEFGASEDQAIAALCPPAKALDSAASQMEALSDNAW